MASNCYIIRCAANSANPLRRLMCLNNYYQPIIPISYTNVQAPIQKHRMYSISAYSQKNLKPSFPRSLQNTFIKESTAVLYRQLEIQVSNLFQLRTK